MKDVERRQSRLGWAVEFAPGEYLTDDGGTVCVWGNKAKAEQQAVWQRELEDAWSGIRLVPVCFYAPDTTATP